jgi:hypothetical protein
MPSVGEGRVEVFAQCGDDRGTPIERYSIDSTA